MSKISCYCFQNSCVPVNEDEPSILPQTELVFMRDSLFIFFCPQDPHRGVRFSYFLVLYWNPFPSKFLIIFIVARVICLRGVFCRWICFSCWGFIHSILFIPYKYDLLRVLFSCWECMLKLLFPLSHVITNSRWIYYV